MASNTHILYVGALVAVSLLLGIFIVRGEYNHVGYILVVLTLSLVIVFFVIPRVVSGEGKLLLWALIGAFFLKAGASYFRMIWGWDVKDGRIDAGRYIRTGLPLAEEIRNLQFDSVLLYLSRQGTNFVEGFTGVVFAIIGPTVHGGFLVFATFAFIGSCLFYRAYRIAFPAGNRYVFFGLIFFYPSWLYWPSSIGKDALMALSIGLVVYGAAKFLRQGSIMGILIGAAGVGGAYLVRPHIALLIVAALGICILFRQYRLGVLGPMVRVAMVVTVLGAGWLILDRAASFVRMDEVSLEAALDQYENFQDTAARGGAAFTPIPITHPLGVPAAFITVLYRPFPWEAHRAAALMLALESSTLLGLTILRFGSLKAAIASARSDPFLIFIFVYVLLCILVFTSFGNFSIVGRQRLQFLPLFFMLLAYPTAAERRRAEAGDSGQLPVSGSAKAAPRLAQRTV